jgi:hypothetical protein
MPVISAFFILAPGINPGGQITIVSMEIVGLVHKILDMTKTGIIVPDLKIGV